MSDANYEVGQILYVLSESSERVVPVQVCEELRRRTIAGEEITYLVRTGPTGEQRPLSEVSGTVFSKTEDVCAHMRVRFDAFLKAQMEWTANAQRTWYSR